MIVRVNGRSVGPEQAAVSALDHGFLYGNGLFETMRALDGRPFALDRHLDRLAASAPVIGLPLPRRGALAQEVMEAVAEAGESDAYVRLTVTRGPGAAGPDPSTCREPTVMVVVKALPTPPERWATEGLRLVVSPIRRNSFSPLTRVKSTNYLECILAKQAARQEGADEALFLDSEGSLAEATAWNVFLMERDRLLTPSDSGPILPGITRAIVLDLARERDLPWETGTYAPDRLASADEAFLTNSLYGVVPVGSLDGEPLGRGRPGPVTRALAEAYDELLRAPTGPGRGDP